MGKRQIDRLFFTLFSLFALAACGPEEPNNDSEEETPPVEKTALNRAPQWSLPSIVANRVDFQGCNGSLDTLECVDPAFLFGGPDRNIIVDLDQDGLMDALTLRTRLSHNILLWIRNLGDGHYASIILDLELVKNGGAEYYPQKHRLFQLNDKNHDGLVDILFISKDKEIKWAMNQGRGRFEITDLLPAQERIRSIYLDSETGDIAWWDKFNKFVHIFHGTDGQPLQQKTINLAEVYKDLQFVDFDKDGDIDGLAPNGSNLVLYENHKNQILRPRILLSRDSEITLLGIKDIDADDLSDLVIKSKNRVDVLFYEKNNTFQALEFQTNGDVDWLVIEDFNGDGLEDLYLARRSPSKDQRAIYFPALGVRAFAKRSITGGDYLASYYFHYPLPLSGYKDSSIHLLAGFYKLVLQEQVKLNHASGQSFIHKPTATDLDFDPLTYSLVPSPDSDFFEINSSTGEVHSKSVLENNSQDADGDNGYELQISVTDGIAINPINLRVQVYRDSDNDGINDFDDTDDDNDGVSDLGDRFPLDPTEHSDLDRDGIGDNSDPDIDNDGIANADDPDDDGDGRNDNEDKFPLNPREWADNDKDGLGDNKDRDDDNDGTIDSEDTDPFDPLQSHAPVWQVQATPLFEDLPYNTEAVVPPKDQIQFYDLDGNGKPDIVLLSPTHLHVRSNQVDPQFSSHILRPIVAENQLEFTDVNKDGRIDIVLHFPNKKHDIWFENLGWLEFKKHGDITLPTNKRLPVTIVNVTNENELTRDTLAGPQRQNEHVTGKRNIIQTLPISSRGEKVYRGDFNGNGIEDEIVTFDHPVSLGPGLTCSRSQEYLSEDELACANGWHVEHIFDFENDQRHEVVARAYGLDTGIYSIDENFSWNLIVALTSNYSTAFIMGDWDNDGDTDFIRRASRQYVWLENHNGKFNKIVIPRNLEMYEQTLDYSNGQYSFNDIVYTSKNQTKRARFQGHLQFEINQGQTELATLTASDQNDNALSYAIMDGLDSKYFSYDTLTNKLSFDGSLKVAERRDRNYDNHFEVAVTVNDGTSTVPLIVVVSLVE